MQQEKIALVEWAKEQAETLLSPLGKRWLHVQGVAERARQTSWIFNEEDSSYLLAAAYLHDIGYAPSLKKTGFHPLDGAVYLRSLGEERLACLVAHHSGAHFEAQLRGYISQLNTFPHEQSSVADALTYCDMTTGPTGNHITLQERIDDILQRYNEGDIVNQAIHEALPFLFTAVKKTELQLDTNFGIYYWYLPK